MWLLKSSSAEVALQGAFTWDTNIFMFFAPSERSVQQTVKNLSPLTPISISTGFYQPFSLCLLKLQKKKKTHFQLCPSLITNETILSYVFGYLCLWYFPPLKSKQILSLLVVLPGHFTGHLQRRYYSTHPSNSSPAPTTYSPYNHSHFSSFPRPFLGPEMIFLPFSNWQTFHHPSRTSLKSATLHPQCQCIAWDRRGI